MFFNKRKKKNEIVHYSTSLVGKSHITKGTVCQDANRVNEMSNGWIVAAIADGVGSAKFSDIASKTAVDTVVNYCSKHIDKNTKQEELCEILSNAFETAEMSIEAIARSNNASMLDYDTTLSVVVYDGLHIAYGHSGDGGIVGMCMNGSYKKITEPQKADDGFCVIPLRAGKNSWKFGIETEEFASVLLATDGLYDTFFPYLLKGQSVEVYVPLIRYFMDNAIVGANKENIDDIRKAKEAFLVSDAYDSVSDDKTLVVLINSTLETQKQDDSYYDEPDWDKLQSDWNKKAYPHLYNDEKNVDAVGEDT